MSADTHKYGYALKGTSVLTFRDQALRNSQYFFLTDWSGGKYCSPGMEGSAPVGCSPPRGRRWCISAGRVPQPRPAHLRDRRRSCRTRCGRIPSFKSAGSPTFLFSFTSDAFDVYHVNDFMRLRGWRLNGQQYPNALHMAVTRPQTQAGVADAFAVDLADAVEYARDTRTSRPSPAAIYGGVAGGMTDEADTFIKAVMADMMDGYQQVPGEE